jgi:hypothetical protein
MKVKSLFKVAGIVLAALFAVSMFASASASAAHWSVCLAEHSGTTTTKWSSAQCSTAKATGGFEWSEVAGTEAAKVVSQTIELTDTKVPLIGSTTVICAAGSGEGTGAVGPGKFGRINSTKVNSPSTNCKGSGGCKSAGIKVVEARNTPWQTELVETESKVLAIITSTGAGEPGWEVKCENILGSETTDICLAEPEKPEKAQLLNVATGTELLVLGTFEKAHKAKCEEGGKESGEVGGSVANLLTSGAALSALLH